MSRGTKFVLLVLGAGLLYLCLYAIPQRMIRHPENPIVHTPAAVDLAYEDVVLFPAGSTLELAAWWMEAEEPVAALVFVHGGGSNRHSEFVNALALYKRLVGAGISVLSLDLRNHGDSGGDGRGLQFGRTEKADAASAITWVRQYYPRLPIFAMGVSMGGATVIQAAADGASVDGLILLDPLLDSHSALRQGGWVESGLPPALFIPSAWAATAFYGLPAGDAQALQRAMRLRLPILLLQDPADPVTLAEYAVALAEVNPAVMLWMAPEIPENHPDMDWKRRWGAHAAAFALYPDQVMAQITDFIAVNSRR